MSELDQAADRQAVLRKALLEIRRMRAELDASERARTEPIAVVGIGCRFPGGAADPDAFWQLLREGVDAVVEVPPGRWDADAFFDPSPEAPGKMYTRHGGFLREDPALFDGDFFRISPREVLSMDPQQRLLLEVAWEALERAGHGVRTPDGGVFVGISTNDYAQYAMFADPAQIDVYSATGNALNAASGRLAHFLGFRGPAVTVDTACSSSLVAVHLACQSLRAGECGVVLAGGVNLMLAPYGTIATSRARMMAADGRCKTFDARADGYVRGEGCALVVLRRLSDALADGDPVLALILGSSVNHDGASSALTVPNGAAQRELLRRALQAARVEPAEVSYLEAHGTGTPLGDPIEIDALRAVLAEGRAPGEVCAIGSVKTNIGHLEAAAGVAGLAKTVLALHQGEIPAHLHLRELNPQIALDGTRFQVPTETRPWPRSGRRRVAGVSSFGFTGTNAHVVLGEAPPVPEAGAPAADVHLLPLSAHSDAALAALAQRYAAHLRAHPEQELADVAFTAAVGRSHLSHRLAVPGRSH
ncbi:MAG TPA: polyketide synthase, partial [Longimicrobiaceae bacterium]|nr:polyketide synthase [Longimicrobiaceae bacterium]